MRFSPWLVAVWSVWLLAGPCEAPGEGDGEPAAVEGDGTPVSPNRGFVAVNAGLGCAFRDDGTRLCWHFRPTHLPPLPDRVVDLDGLFGLGGDLCWIHTDGTLECQTLHMDDIVGPPEDPFPGYEEFPFPGRRFMALSGGRYACAIDVDGALECTDYGYPIDWAWDGPGAHPTEGRFVSVSAGDPHMCGVREGGELLCWSSEYYRRRQLGVLSPPAGEFTSVSVGTWRACAVRVGGQVVCWGDEEHDDGHFSPFDGLFQAVSVGWGVCGLRIDGEVECWGRNWNEGAGVWPRGPFVALDVDHQICALRPGGEVVCWGDGSGMHRPPDDAFVALDAGHTATCGLRADGEVVCWGYETRLNRARTPLAWDVPAGPFSAISVGDSYACALRPSGEVACWGRGKLPPIYHGETYEERENRRRLEPPPGPFSAISAFDEFTCGLRPDGEAVCWGMHDTYHEIELVAPPPGPFSAIRAGSWSACGLRPGGEALCWDTRDGAPTAGGGEFVALTDGRPQPCGLRAGGEFACTDPRRYGHLDAPGTAFQSVASRTHTCGLDFAGEITCWSARVWHEPTPPGPFTAVTVGNAHSCGLRPDGTAECWTPHWPPSADPVYSAATGGSGGAGGENDGNPPA